MSRQKKKTPAPMHSAGFSDRGVLVENPAKQIALLNQAMPIIRERVGSDDTACKLVSAAEKALAAAKRLKEEPEILDHYSLKISAEELGGRFEAVLVFSFALTAKLETEKAVTGLERALVDDEETIRQMALESLVEYHWSAGNFREIDLLMKIPQLRETVAACLWAASIRLDDSEVPLDSRRYLRTIMMDEAKSGNKTAEMFLEEARKIAGLD